jgi:hypothetical protein
MLEFNRLHPARAALGCICAVLGAWVAWHHPGSGRLALLGFSVLVVWSLGFPQTVWWLVPAALPWIGFAPWTGWFTFEEFDLLVLSLAAGAWLRSSWRAALCDVPVQRVGALVSLAVMLFAASTAVAMWRGFGDAGGFAWGWFQGYHEPMNSLRLAKSFFLALLLWHLWRMAAAEVPQLSSARWALGMTLGLIGVSLAAVWERAAYTGLLNFSTDYRTTALFWEMHVGGAALDGFLALSVPFALSQLLQERSGWRWWACALALLLAAYVCLTTFSRGVYLAVPVGMALTYWLLHKQRVRNTPLPTQLGNLRDLMWSLGLLAVFTACAAWMFPSSGYRGMLALWGAFSLLMALAPQLRSLTAWQWLQSLCGGLVLVVLMVILQNTSDKGAYLAYAAASAFTALAIAGLLGMFGTAGRLSRGAVLVGAVSGLWAVWFAMVLVTWHWGGEAAAQRSLAPVFVLAGLLVWVGRGAGAHWPQRWRGQCSLMGALAIGAVMVGIFLGGSYMNQRFSTGDKDLQDRWLHWQIGLHALSSPLDWALGKGLGRFPASHFHSGHTQDQTGDYRVRVENGNPYVAISSGKHVLGWGEMFRLSQRVAPAVGASTVTFDVRTATPVVLHFEVCEKHLLYNAACVIKPLAVPASTPTWQHHSVVLEGGQIPSRGSWYAPKLLMFSVSMTTQGSVAELDNLQLTDAISTALLRNGDFSNNLAGWFFTSDRHHMPWHIKSMFMHVLFDQGLVGVVLWLALSVGALWRVTWGAAKNHPLAPALAGALLSFWVVGLFDSLLDVPRIAALYYVLMLMALVASNLKKVEIKHEVFTGHSAVLR